MTIEDATKIAKLDLKEYNNALLRRLIAERYELPIEAIQLEMLDFFEIVAMGAKKYALNNWLEPNGKKSSERDMHSSMGRHWAESQSGPTIRVVKGEYGNVLRETHSRADKESGKDPLLHLMCRAGMVYTRRKLGIVHEEDK